MTEQAKKFGTCPYCKRERMLDFFLASRHGQPVSGFMCSECLDKIKSDQGRRCHDGGRPGTDPEGAEV